MNLASYLEQFLGDDEADIEFSRDVAVFGGKAFEMVYAEFWSAIVSSLRIPMEELTPPSRSSGEELRAAKDYYALCRAAGHHSWYRLLGGFQCRQCGLQIPMKEPASPFELQAALRRSTELDAELK